jgi:hypothetical protein
MAVHNYGVIHIKGETENNDNGPFLHLGIRILWFGASSPYGFGGIHLVGIVQDPESSRDVSPDARLVPAFVLKGL